MKTQLKLALISLLAVALFVPQQSQAGMTKEWLLVGTGIAVLGLIGYEFLSNNEINDIAESTISEEKEEENVFSTNMFKLEDYNDNTNNELPDIFWLKNSFTPQEYAQKLKELIEDEEVLFSVDHIFWIIKQKNVMKNVVEHMFTTEEENEEKTLLQIAKGTWAEDTVTTHYQNHYLEEKKLYHEHLVSLIDKKRKQTIIKQ